MLLALAFFLSACGASSPAVSLRRAPGRQHAAARIPPASAVPLTPTPRMALELCRRSRLLRPVCPRLVPLSLHPDNYYLADGCANAVNITITSGRCTLPDWSYEVFAPLPGQTTATHVRAWDGREWFTPSYAPMDPPPYHVHIDIQAAAGTEPASIVGPSFANAETVHRVSDVLLNPHRARAVSIGWVHWYGSYGRLVLAPTNPDGGGEEAGHLIFYFTAGGVNYDISLHAWASKERVSGPGVNRVADAPETGPALPHVIATLEAIVGSALGSYQ